MKESIALFLRVGSIDALPANGLECNLFGSDSNGTEQLFIALWWGFKYHFSGARKW
jgi:hypothetical protein